jgi:Tat protein secretion system quality control protein TatD with DNase activity
MTVNKWEFALVHCFSSKAQSLANVFALEIRAGFKDFVVRYAVRHHPDDSMT